jgi:alpha-tubulin suppressor-like RCC1 family protein/serine/threonine protein kinase
VAGEKPLGDGERVGDYRIVRVLGVGGMGTVYLAHDERLERQVALKVIAPHLAHDTGFRQRFEAEVRSAAAIEHPNVVPVYTAGSTNGSVFLAMRFVDGTDLRALLRESGPLQVSLALKILTEIAAALDAAHAAGLVHRDVKPANILIEGAPEVGQTYLTDFGLTKGSHAQLTATGQWIGTLDYVAPEQMAGGRVDARTDVYALGCVLYEMLSGSVPFSGDDMQKMWAQANEPVPALVGCDGAMNAVIAQATAKDPAQRFPSAGSLAKAARATAAGTVEHVDSSSTRSIHRPAPLRTEQATTTMPAPRRERPRTPGSSRVSSGRTAAIIAAVIVLAGGMIVAAFVAGGKTGGTESHAVGSGRDTQIAAGVYHSLALTPPGRLYAFGLNQYGQLGNTANDTSGKPNARPTLVALPGASGPGIQVATGYVHSLALTSTGQLYAFGENHFGQLGNPTNERSDNPNPTPTLVTLPGASGKITQIAAGGNHSLALTSTGQLYAFGENAFGQLGNATNLGSEEPNPTPTLVTLPGASGKITQIAAGAYHSLVLTSTGQLYAFGSNRYGQLGNPTKGGSGKPSATPTLVTLPGASGPVVQVAAGYIHSLALTSTGQLYAFGENAFGQLGNATNLGSEEPNPTPTLVTLPGASGKITQIAGGGRDSLALTSTGQLYAFGKNQFGQLGNATNLGSEEPNPTPTLVTLPGASGKITQIAAGARHSLALTSTGEFYAFGENQFGQLGDATNLESEAPNPTPNRSRIP